VRRHRVGALFAVACAAATACVPTDYVFVADESSSPGGAAQVGGGPGTGGGGAGGMEPAAGGGGSSTATTGGAGGMPCARPSDFQTATFDSNTFGWQGFVTADGSVGYQYMQAGCEPAQPGSVARAFFHFATESLPATAVVGSARIQLCGISFGGPGAAVLFDTSFALPVDAPDFEAGATDLGAQPSSEFGPHWVDVPPSSVDVGAPSQYSLRYSDETCPSGAAWRRYATDGDHPGESCPHPSPPLLEVSYCDPAR
jgi:hypothetical protein